MKKALILVALFLVPFLSVKADIWTDGTIDTQAPKSTACDIWTYAPNPSVESCDFSADSALTAFTSGETFNSDYYFSCYVDSVTTVSDKATRATIFCSYNVISNGVTYTNTGKAGTSLGSFARVDESEQCPPDSHPSYVSSHMTSETSFVCYSPSQLNMNDSCNASSGNEYLTIDVSAPSGCFPQPDGSICKYDAVDLGGGNEFYAMDLEGDCYENPDDLPTLSGTPKGNPANGDCKDYGGILACPADPKDVCSSGSAYAGGSIADCQTGCGMINDQFLCIDQDTDGDGIPDYDDPDIDGDGIPNRDDLDSNGDGKDDPKSSGTGVGGGIGGKPVDLGPVISELKKANKFLDEIVSEQSIADGTEIKQLINEKKEDLETRTNEFLNNSDLSGIENFAATNGIQSDFFQINSSISGSSCNNPTHSELGQFGICEKISAARPFLYIAFGLLTFIALIYRFAFYIKGSS